MPNWCDTVITINSGDEDRLKEFDKLLDKWTSKNYMENGFGLNWLGNVVGNSGIGTVDENSDSDLRCRGSILSKELYGDRLTVITETAWNPMLKMWTKLLEKYLPDAELTYTAEECGNGFYSTNDTHLDGLYVIDCWDIDDIESDYKASEGVVKELLQKLLNTTETDINKLLVLLSKSEYRDKISINKWKYNDALVWD